MESLDLNIKNIISGKKFTILFPILIIVLIICAIIIFIPSLNKLRNLENQLKAQNLKLEKVKNEISSSGKTKSRMVTDLEEVAQALDEITKKATQLNFKFDSIKQGDSFAIGDNFKILPLTIESTCSFKALSEFVSSLENLRRSVVVVKRLDVVKDKANPKNLKVSLELGMYLLI